jgi:CHAD domain-containing protein
MAKAREIPGLGPDISLRDAAARTVQVRTAEVFSFADGVLDTTDIERVHDMRVATRRLRAALEAYKPVFPKAEFKQTLGDVKTLARALGSRRDPDVALETVEAIAGHLPAAARPGVDLFEDELRTEQIEGNAELARVLAQTLDSQLEARLLELAAAAEDDGNTTFGAFLSENLEKRRARLRKLAEKGHDSDAVDVLHKARIAAKRLRYLYELGESHSAGVKFTRGLQDVLGEIHDCDVMSARLRARALELPVEDERYIGLEALASYLDAKRRVLHRQFMNMWENGKL